MAAATRATTCGIVSPSTSTIASASTQEALRAVGDLVREERERILAEERTVILVVEAARERVGARSQPDAEEAGADEGVKAALVLDDAPGRADHRPLWRGEGVEQVARLEVVEDAGPVAVANLARVQLGRRADRVVVVGEGSPSLGASSVATAVLPVPMRPSRTMWEPEGVEDEVMVENLSQARPVMTSLARFGASYYAASAAAAILTDDRAIDFSRSPS